MKNNQDNYYNYNRIFGTMVDFQNKEENLQNHILYMLDRTARMFKYNRLPDSIPQRELEIILQTGGKGFIKEVNGELYAFAGTLSGAPDVYYNPTEFVIANPALNLSGSYAIDKDGILIRNDTLMRGLMPMLNKYATMLAENELTLNIADINARIITLITATTDAAKKSAEEYIRQIKDGKLSIIAGKGITDDGAVKSQPYGGNSQNYITQLLELEQYIKGALWQDLGLQSAYNMKREALNSAETSQDNDILLPFVDDMLINRQEAVDKINAMFGTNITVELDSAWKNNAMEAEAHVEMVEAQVSALEAGSENMEEGAQNQQVDEAPEEDTEGAEE